YSSFNLDPNDEATNQRFLPRQDQGEHEVSYRILVGKRFSETRVSRAAQILNTPPVWQVYYPQPDRVDKKRRASVTDTVIVDDAHVQVVALKKSQKGNALIVRLQNTSGQSRDISVQVKPHRQKMQLTVGAYGLATIAVNKGGKSLRWREVDLVERPVPKARGSKK
ncbi:MAG: hypothetical protein HOH74_15635, partial [Gemmatimonadetes bacterium]|nr:hypothetical protein [Gemmatimonadota bacterium]